MFLLLTNLIQRLKPTMDFIYSLCRHTTALADVFLPHKNVTMAFLQKDDDEQMRSHVHTHLTLWKSISEAVKCDGCSQKLTISAYLDTTQSTFL